ncbi:MMPL family transporter [Nocardioides sp. TF02-7]|nr:MMPL family transporter [Nocardioides sp. TF02-7]UMG94904.1 MMPL family transporter [Nocardioides sp. TF02-7]
MLSTAAAFGVARLIFQDGHGAGLLGFESQGFLDAWAPVFFFAMIFAIAMDYTVFLLASAKEHWEKTGDPREAMVGAVAHSGRVIFAAGGVMVAVFFTFALSGPPAAEGDGRHPRRRGPPRRLPRPARAAAGDAPSLRPRRLGHTRMAVPRPPEDHLLSRLKGTP